MCQAWILAEQTAISNVPDENIESESGHQKMDFNPSEHRSNPSN